MDKITPPIFNILKYDKDSGDVIIYQNTYIENVIKNKLQFLCRYDINKFTTAIMYMRIIPEQEYKTKDDTIKCHEIE